MAGASARRNAGEAAGDPGGKDRRPANLRPCGCGGPGHRYLRAAGSAGAGPGPIVIAGPVVARSLAEHGADVLRVTSPMMQGSVSPDRGHQYRQTLGLPGPGPEPWTWKRRAEAGRRRRRGGAIVAARQPGAARAGRGRSRAHPSGGGLRQRQLLRGHRALGRSRRLRATGPGDQRRVRRRSCDGSAPRIVPTYLLNDYLTGYLGAAGVSEGADPPRARKAAAITSRCRWRGPRCGCRSWPGSRLRRRQAAALPRAKLTLTPGARNTAVGIRAPGTIAAGGMFFAHAGGLGSRRPRPIGAHAPEWLAP